MEEKLTKLIYLLTPPLIITSMNGKSELYFENGNGKIYFYYNVFEDGELNINGFSINGYFVKDIQKYMPLKFKVIEEVAIKWLLKNYGDEIKKLIE